MEDVQGQTVGEPFVTNSTGRAIYDGKLDIGASYTLRETFAPVPNVQPVVHPFTMEKANQQLRVENIVTVANGPYGLAPS